MQLKISLDKVEIAAEHLLDCEKKLQFLWEKMSEEMDDLHRLREEALFYVERDFRRERDALWNELEAFRKCREMLEQIVERYQKAEERIQDFEEVLPWQPEYYLLHQLEQTEKQLKEWGIHIM